MNIKSMEVDYVKVMSDVAKTSVIDMVFSLKNQLRQADFETPETLTVEFAKSNIALFSGLLKALESDSISSVLAMCKSINTSRRHTFRNRCYYLRKLFEESKIDDPFILSLLDVLSDPQIIVLCKSIKHAESPQTNVGPKQKVKRQRKAKNKGSKVGNQGQKGGAVRERIGMDETSNVLELISCLQMGTQRVVFEVSNTFLQGLSKSGACQIRIEDQGYSSEEEEFR